VAIVASRYGVDPITAQSYQRSIFVLEIQRNWRNFQTTLASRFKVILAALRLRAWRMNQCRSRSDDRGEGGDCHNRSNKLLFLQNRSPSLY
jgi:hypothetical protein